MDGARLATIDLPDGIALADEALRVELAALCPVAWARIEARRRFMIDAFGIALHPDVLPFSNMPGFLPPYLLRSDLAMAAAR